MKFKTDRFGDRELEHKDDDGDRLRVISYLGGGITIAVNMEAVMVTDKQLRKFAKAILKETEK